MNVIASVDISNQTITLETDTTYVDCDVRGTAFTTNGYGLHLIGNCERNVETTINGTSVF